MILTHDRPEYFFKSLFQPAFKIIPAAGGIVLRNSQILFIYRNNIWDLPKGKTEKKETIEETALREVSEETGVEDLKVTKPLQTTYHIFKRNGRYRIKITYWFEMTTSFSGDLVAEETEGITKVKWLNEEQVKEAMENSYANIKTLI